ncbi:hypothetical protein [Glycomyces salinus]|nr:hypothetical protein [Glycomyces salinus]
MVRFVGGLEWALGGRRSLPGVVERGEDFGVTHEVLPVRYGDRP